MMEAKDIEYPYYFPGIYFTPQGGGERNLKQGNGII